MTDFRAKGTIMGPTGLTAVFGMGTGVTPSVWSPEKRPADGRVRRSWFVGRKYALHACFRMRRRTPQLDPLSGSASHCIAAHLDRGPLRGRRGPIGVVKPLGC